MKKLRKVIAQMLALALVLSMLFANGLAVLAADAVTDATESGESTETTTPVEEVSEETAQAAALLQSLNVLKGDEDGNLNLTGDVTRAEFATFIVRMMGQESVALSSAGQQIFDDVDANHWGNGYISVAYNAGVILGYGNGKFGPEDPVTYEQAIKMIVCALGYGAMADDRGGWPTGYLLVANDKKITKGVTILSDTAAKRGDIVSMIYNSLELDVMRSSQVIKDGETAVSYTVVEGENVLTYFLGLEKAEGIVTANGDTRINSTGAALNKDNQIELSYTDKFDVGETDAADYLGHAVAIYCTYDSVLETRTILFIKPLSKDTTVVIPGEEISNSTTLSEMVWNPDDDTEETMSIDAGAQVIVNRRYKGTIGDSGVVLSDIMPDNGTVTLIDNNGDEYADVISVDAYQTLVVKQVADSLDMIYDLYTDKGYKLDLDSRTETVSIVSASGDDMVLNKIAEWNVVCLYQSGDGKIKKAVVSTDKAKGTLSKKTSDGKYTVNGVTYELSKVYKDYLAANAGATPSLGSDYTFLLDIDGKIAGRENSSVSIVSGNTKYGYLVKSTKDAVNDQIRLQIYTTAGKFQDFYLADEVKINGYPKDPTTRDENDLLFPNERRSRNLITISTADLVSNSTYFNSIFSTGAVIYTTDSDGKISELRVDTSGTESYADYDSRYAGQFVKARSSSDSVTYYDGVLNGKYFITSKTVGLTIPNDLSDKDFFSPALPELKSTNTYNVYAMDLYDVNEKGEVGLAVVRTDYTVDVNLVSDTIYAVKELNQEVNKDDEIVTSMTLISGSTERTKEVASSTYYIANNMSAAKTMSADLVAAYAAEGINLRADYEMDAKTNHDVIDDLRFGDVGMATVKNNVYATYIPIFKMTGIEVGTGAEVCLKDYHFEYADHSGKAYYNLNATGTGKTLAELTDLSDETIPMKLNDSFMRYYRVTMYGEATASGTTTVRMFTTTEKDENGNLYRNERLIPANNVTVTIVDMTNQTIKSGSMKDIVPGDKILYTYNYDLKGSIFIYRW